MDLTLWITDLSLHGKRVNHNNKGAADLTNPNTLKYRQRRERLVEQRRQNGIAEPVGAPLSVYTLT